MPRRFHHLLSLRSKAGVSVGARHAVPAGGFPFARYSAALLLACLPCPAQQPGETPTFRTGTTLIEFTIVAMDSDGNPVSDLKQEEISITEDGESREVAFFRFEGGVSDTPPPEPLPPGIFSNRPEHTPGPPRNVTAIVFDALNTQPSEQAWVRDQLKKYLRTTAAETRIAVYRMGRKRISLVHDFSDDTDLLLGRVDKIPTELPLVMYSSHEMESEWLRSLGQRFGGRDTGGAFERALAAARGGSQIARAHYQRMNQSLTLEYLLAIGNHLEGIPGRKSLVWFSGAFPVLTAQAGWLENDEFLIRNTLQHLASQGIVFYPVHAVGLQTPVHSASSPAGPPRPDPRGSLQFAGRSIGGMYVAAALTGGRVTAGTNDLTEGLKAAADDLRGAYTAGFYAVGEPDNQWHTLHVAGKRPGVKLAHRQGYLSQAPAPQPLRWSHDHWRVVIASPIQSTAVRLDVLCEPVADTAAGAYDFVLRIPSEDLLFREIEGQITADVEVTVAEKTSAGEFEFWIERGRLHPSETLATPKTEVLLRYTKRWKIKPGTSTVRIIVRDRFTGRHGTLDIPVKEILGEAVATPAEAPAN